ncbi:META domain-containing protein [Cellulomonas edaphi]|uniref:META domain-containing protein n=1 Tax=Cellulomonas edaphi TaxID=3053468 RepID=A0ABT7S845_9CELL|nr:META domain-containing protein [Cellulomons edaphi]MDM7831795.1 META domain-containing protein [Cellulomons edaphi]
MRLVGTWIVTALDGRPTPADERHCPWLTFDGDGQVFGLGGVNRIRGTWAVDGDALTFGPMVSTLMAGPPEAMEAGQALHRLLARPLTLRAADGAAARSADPALEPDPALEADPALEPAAAGVGRPTHVDLVADDGASIALPRTAARS